MTKTVYLFDESGDLIGIYQAQESPLEPGIFITPTASTDIEPPTFTENQTCKFIEGSWVVADVPKVIPEPPSPEEIAQIEASERFVKLNSITVTTASGKRFDGNEIARGDMLSAISIAGFTGQASTNWKLADNSFANVSLDELKEALTLALAEKGRIVGAIS